ncbi:MAG: ATPase domain-containing protein [Candidatus ainarchaeum sp.]|nr:ATPase domain-containing protein [Candidatus ainarchaeum sp.]
MERVATGIPGLDELLKGGIPRGSSVLVSGGPGAGKSIFSMQYIVEGARLYDECGLYVSIESNPKNIMWDMASFNWDIKKFQDKKMINIYRMKMGYNKDPKMVEDKIDEELETIGSMMKEMNAKRLVIDSTTSLGIWFDKAILRAMLFKFVDYLKELDCTTILTSEAPNLKERFSAFGVEEFITDGVIALFFTPPYRSIFVRKMRGTAHDKNLHPFEITDKGIMVKPKETVLWEATK